LKKYKTLLFDADDTLLDFGAAESLALRLLFADQELTLTAELETHYKELNKSLWRAYEEGRMTRDEVVNTRFSLLFKEYGQEVDGVLLEENYRKYLEEGHQLVNGALDVVKNLYHHHYDLYIVTNGISDTQDKRLRDSGLYPFFKGIFVSEDTGFQKPMKEYFDYVFAKIPGFAVEQGIIIGDSLSSDIKGGMLAGLDTCWFNPQMKPNITEIAPTYQIQALDDLYKILMMDRGNAGLMKIRTVKMDDLAKIEVIENSCFSKEEAATKDAFKQRIQCISDSFFVAEEDGVIKGLVNGPVIKNRFITDDLFSVIKENPPYGGHQSILGLAVHPKYQKQGVAQALLSRIEKEARLKGRETITLTCKENVIRFYERQGFVNCGASNSQHGGVLWYNMTKRLM
jgi:2-haloacid dehalogenase